ncbi:MAG TPA: membrane protein insertase YidC [Jatrophihabitans sp.]|nr:membrane protein insertase YidC [Jatrophihabitans sp.]
MLDFLYTAVSWVLLRWHDLFTIMGFSDSSGIGWALSIIFLVVTARLLLFRLFVKQVHYQRNMQRMQPKMQQIREKYKSDRAEMNRQMMALQQEEGFNPLTGCLPMFLQIPVFLGLYHVLRHLSNSVDICHRLASGQPITAKSASLLTQYTFSQSETCHAATAQIFNTPLAASFHDSNDVIRALGGDPTSSRITLVILLIISAGATLGTQLLVRRNATTTPEGTAATIQRLMIWLIPIGVLGSGLLFNFPLGVLLYWFTSNLWTLGQQAWIIHYHPQVEEERKPVGELGKALAPKPGQRPVRPPKGKPVAEQAVPQTGIEPDEPSGTPSTPSDTGAARSTAPRPGQRPNRSSGKRPPAKRPTQAKKRR